MQLPKERLYQASNRSLLSAFFYFPGHSPYLIMENGCGICVYDEMRTFHMVYFLHDVFALQSYHLNISKFVECASCRTQQEVRMQPQLDIVQPGFRRLGGIIISLARNCLSLDILKSFRKTSLCRYPVSGYSSVRETQALLTFFFLLKGGKPSSRILPITKKKMTFLGRSQSTSGALYDPVSSSR